MQKSVIFLILIALISFLLVKPAFSDNLQLLDVAYPSTIDSGKPIVVTATILHNKSSIPTVTLYYAYFLNQTILAGGWKIVKADLNYTNGLGVSIYEAEIPNPAYKEVIPYNSKIIFYLEINDPLEGVLLTCDENERWNPYAQLDKYSILIVDESPPEIIKVNQIPKAPTELDSVTITVTAIDNASGIAKVKLHYWIGEEETIEDMELTSEGFYAAVIPSQPKGKEVAYYAVAIDNAGNKAFSNIQSYMVASSPLLQSYQAKRVLTYLIVSAIIIIIILALSALYLWRKGVKIAVKPLECKHPKAMTLFMIIAFAIAAILYYQLNQLGSPLIGLLIAIAIVASWSFLDPRALAPFKLKLDENPPSTLIAEGLIIALIGGILIIGSATIGLHSLAYAYSLAVLIGKYAVGLMASGLILQLAWPYLKEIEVSIEVEEQEAVG
ncbi:MAG: hypothetical protein QW303_02280 [Nitrososphaerota archaeon]